MVCHAAWCAGVRAFSTKPRPRHGATAVRFAVVWEAPKEHPMKKFVLAFFGVVAVIGFVMADEFNANITKVEGNTVYFKKAGGGGKKGAPATEEKADVAADAKIVK